jgi:hypothetical protein
LVFKNVIPLPGLFTVSAKKSDETT